jgi:tetratricopeptide (TPR) repeat protein
MIAHVLQELGDSDQSLEFYGKAAGAKISEGISEITYYRGAALKSLGRAAEAAEVFESMVRAGESELAAEGGMDFFAKFGQKESRDVRIAHARYVRGLGYLGQGDLKRARKDFAEAVSLNPNHIWAKVGLEALD